MLRQATKKLSAGLNLRAAANWGSLQAFNRGKASESNHGSNLPKKMGTTQVGDAVKAGSSTPMPTDLNGGKRIFRPFPVDDVLAPGRPP